MAGECLPASRILTPQTWPAALRQYFVNNTRFLNPCELHIKSLVAEGECAVIDAEEVEHRGVHVADVDDVLGRVVTEFVRVAVLPRVSRRRRPATS